MWDDVGILRTAEGLARARHELNNLATSDFAAWASPIRRSATT